MYNKASDVEYSRTIQTAKQDYFTNLCESLNDPNMCRKSWWKLAKSAFGTGFKDSCSTPDLLDNGNIISDPVEKCNLFNSFFVKQPI
jgi:hypothetical protein